MLTSSYGSRTGCSSRTGTSPGPTKTPSPAEPPRDPRSLLARKEHGAHGSTTSPQRPVTTSQGPASCAAKEAGRPERARRCDLLSSRFRRQGAGLVGGGHTWRPVIGTPAFVGRLPMYRARSLRLPPCDGAPPDGDGGQRAAAAPGQRARASAAVPSSSCPRPPSGRSRRDPRSAAGGSGIARRGGGRGSVGGCRAGRRGGRRGRRSSARPVPSRFTR